MTSLGNRFRGLLVGLVLGSALTAVGLGASDALATPGEESPFENLRFFTRALSHIEASYVESVDQDKLIQGAIRGMVAELDPHSVYLDPDEYRILDADTEGEFGGIGVTIEVENGWLTVIAVIEGGPADEAGVEIGDRFIRIGGRDAHDIRVVEAVAAMRGTPDTSVQVSIRREGVPEDLEFTITRRIIEVPPVEGRVLDDGSLYLKVRTFSSNTGSEFRRVVDRLVTEAATRGGVKGILLDLRNNGGGLLSQAIELADEFLEAGVIVSTRGRDGEAIDEAYARRAGTRPDWPLVVLVNGYTASASEIVAGALRDHQRAVVVGTRSFGKGSVQSILEFEDGGALKLTIARYYTPRGRSIQAHGIEPDFLVEPAESDPIYAQIGNREEMRESDLPQHLVGETTDGGVGVTNVPPFELGDDSAPESSPFPDDRQARMAHRALRIMCDARE